MNACDNQSRGNGVASPNTPRWPEADSEDDELEALQEEITRGAHPREVNTRMPVPGISADEEPKQPLDDNPHGGPRRCIRADEETPDDNLLEPRTPPHNPHDAMSGASTPRKGSRPFTPSLALIVNPRELVITRRGTKWGTPSGKQLIHTPKCVASRAYKAAVNEARKQGEDEEGAARAGRKAYKVARAAYVTAMAGSI